jgi:hypothetical protein
MPRTATAHDANGHRRRGTGQDTTSGEMSTSGHARKRQPHARLPTTAQRSPRLYAQTPAGSACHAASREQDHGSAVASAHTTLPASRRPAITQRPASRPGTAGQATRPAQQHPRKTTTIKYNNIIYTKWHLPPDSRAQKAAPRVPAAVQCPVKPKTKGQEPKVKSPRSRAQGQEPKVKSPRSRAQGQEPKVKSKRNWLLSGLGRIRPTLDDHCRRLPGSVKGKPALDRTPPTRPGPSPRPLRVSGSPPQRRRTERAVRAPHAPRPEPGTSPGPRPARPWPQQPLNRQATHGDRGTHGRNGSSVAAGHPAGTRSALDASRTAPGQSRSRIRGSPRTTPNRRTRRQNTRSGHVQHYRNPARNAKLCIEEVAAHPVIPHPRRTGRGHVEAG